MSSSASSLPPLPSDRPGLPGTRVEIVRSPSHPPRVRAVLFDFDGTLSLIREGWPEVMIPMLVDELLRTPRAESEAELRRVVEDFVMRLNGKQTIYQMIQLAEEVTRRGGTPQEPVEYKHEFQRRLLQRIEGRTTALRQGRVDPQDLMVPNALPLLESLRDRGLPLFLASGTDLVYVQQELAALGLDHFFGDRVWGAIDAHQNFSKKMVVDRLVADLDLQPGELLGFGDGFVEIQEVHRVAGVAVGVASDEQHRVAINDWKRNRLIEAGADLIVPDYRDLQPLLTHLLG
ncbi:MAG: HAD family hydrolase [Planctomycetaceae bacterium]